MLREIVDVVLSVFETVLNKVLAILRDPEKDTKEKLKEVCVVFGLSVCVVSALVISTILIILLLQRVGGSPTTVLSVV